ncbi:hypothetical protein CSH63_13490 [Micromonospora tulbaghiae]|uniref:Uncharacterized protein n=1 Tax=Micromonospora tulbaghiae TaxID=479978 RepID=A0A386WK18_9ACTN|nr:hypothetical protein CSH63_13490 [Micromonospora tulbaghiae]
MVTWLLSRMAVTVVPAWVVPTLVRCPATAMAPLLATGQWCRVASVCRGGLVGPPRVGAWVQAWAGVVRWGRALWRRWVL